MILRKNEPKQSQFHALGIKPKYIPQFHSLGDITGGYLLVQQVLVDGCCGEPDCEAYREYQPEG